MRRRPSPDELLGIGMSALIDTTGALAGRKHITGSFTAITPERIVGRRLTRGALAHGGAARGPEDSARASITSTRILIDATSGRGNVAPPLPQRRAARA